MVSAIQRLAVAIVCLSVMCLAQPRTNLNRIFGPAYGKRSQPEMRPQLYDNMVGGDDSEKFQMETLRNPLAWYLANLSPEKRHLLAKLLEMTRMEDGMNDE